MQQHVYGVTEVNQLVKGLLDNTAFLQHIYVRGELSNYKIHSAGHHYFTLKDAEGALKCVMYRSDASTLRFRPESGMQVVACGRISIFPRDGAYQLYCKSMSPEGVGDLTVAYRQLWDKLNGEGLFDPAHKKPLPPYPERIALVTSDTGAAVRDMIKILRARYPLAKVILLPVRVQGPSAAPEIAGAIRYADKWKIGDVIITGRGGGSMEDLWCFNDERVARAIYDCEIPVISAVGHQPDVTIADYVADVRASTPSNAAELAVPDQLDLLRRLRGAEERMAQGETSYMTAARQRLEALASKRVMTDGLAYVQDKRMDLVHLQQRLGDVTGAVLARKKQTFAAMAASLDAMSPLAVLGRGYAVARDETGRILKSYREMAPGDLVSVTLGEGGFTAVVDKPYAKEEQS